MATFLITYATKQGQTQKIADFIAAELERLGHSTTVFNCETIPDLIHPAQYDATIVGAPVHAYRYPRSLRRWVKLHADELSQKPSAFFSVCLSTLQNEAAVRKSEREIVENFIASSHWLPTRWTAFAGALRFSQYNWFLKLFMRSIAKRAGESGDTSRDREYTNWNDVGNFARTFAAEVQTTSRIGKAAAI